MKRVWTELCFNADSGKAEELRFFLAGLKLRGWEEKEGKGRIQFRLWSEREKLAFLRKKLRFIFAGKIRERKIKEEKWGESWKFFFKPVAVGRKLLVVPAWDKHAQKEGRLAVRINPGMAFGTGDHPTTRMCLAAVEERVKKGEKWLDFGTGSGILAIAIARLGAGKIMAVDDDDLAISSAVQNARRNGVLQKIDFRKSDHPPKSGKFDGIVSNLLTEPLALFSQDFIRLLKPGGSFIVSGITKEKASWLSLAYEVLHCKVKLLKSSKGWVCMEIVPPVKAC